MFVTFFKFVFGVSWEQNFQTHRKNVENCKKILKKLGRYSDQKDIANYMLSCNLREELVAVSERQDICNEMGERFLLRLKVIGTGVLTSSLVI